jgi:WD40 repeat protein
MLNNNIQLAASLVYGGINIYNINDGKRISYLKGHKSLVFDLVQLSADLLASSSRDQTVRIWNLTTNTCKFILTGHTRWVSGLKQITSNILASGSSDATIKYAHAHISDSGKMRMWITPNGYGIYGATMSRPIIFSQDAFFNSSRTHKSSIFGVCNWTKNSKCSSVF